MERPSREHDIELTETVWPRIGSPIWIPDVASHTRTVKSLEQEMMYWPLGEYITEFTEFVWPRRGSPVVPHVHASNFLTVPSDKPEMMV